MIAVASVRDWAWTFIRMLLTWFLTVNTLRPSASAISALLRPSAISVATSVSRSVNRASTPMSTRFDAASTRVTSLENDPRPAATSLYRLGEALRVDGLDEVAARPGVDGLANELPMGEGAESEQADRLVGGTHPPDRLDTTDPRHDQIDHDNVGSEPDCSFQAVLATRRLADHLEVVECRQARTDALAKQIVIVDDEHGDWTHPSSLTVSSVP